MNQILLDTNVYISYFIDREESQYIVASSWFEKLENKIIEIYLPSLILAEIVYILYKGYDFKRMEIVNTLAPLISEDNLISENKEILLTTLEFFREENLDFADCYLLAFKEHTNCELVTFDKKLENKT